MTSAAIVQSAQTGPWAAHVGSDVPSVVRSVLISIESDLPLGVRGDEVVGATAGSTMSVEATMSESRRCAEERGICEAARARPPSA